MEPCLFRHGKALAEREEAQIAHELQWSHVFSDMVSATNSAISIHISLVLQWSHVFSDMVREQTPWNPSSPGKCFNGAMSFQTW